MAPIHLSHDVDIGWSDIFSIGHEMNDIDYGPIIGAIIAIGGMAFALAMGYLIGYNDAKAGR